MEKSLSHPTSSLGSEGTLSMLGRIPLLSFIWGGAAGCRVPCWSPVPCGMSGSQGGHPGPVAQLPAPNNGAIEGLEPGAVDREDS